jgi:hypothetical protein
MKETSIKQVWENLNIWGKSALVVLFIMWAAFSGIIAAANSDMISARAKATPQRAAICRLALRSRDHSTRAEIFMKAKGFESESLNSENKSLII